MPIVNIHFDPEEFSVTCARASGPDGAERTEVTIEKRDPSPSSLDAIIDAVEEAIAAPVRGMEKTTVYAGLAAAFGLTEARSAPNPPPLSPTLKKRVAAAVHAFRAPHAPAKKPR
jgi:hypothetical protein